MTRLPALLVGGKPIRTSCTRSLRVLRAAASSAVSRVGDHVHHWDFAILACLLLPFVPASRAVALFGSAASLDIDSAFALLIVLALRAPTSRPPSGHLTAILCTPFDLASSLLVLSPCRRALAGCHRRDFGSTPPRERGSSGWLGLAQRPLSSIQGITRACSCTSSSSSTILCTSRAEVTLGRITSTQRTERRQRRGAGGTTRCSHSEFPSYEWT